MNNQQQPRNSIKRAAEIHEVVAIVEMENMNTKQRIAELEKELAELKVIETSPILLAINEKPQKIVAHNRRHAKVKQVWSNGKSIKTKAVPIIFVEDK